MLRYETIPVTPFQQNSSIVWCDETMEGAVIDPGGDLDLLRSEARRLGVTLKQILLTHAH
ncbi:MAG: MBL fold metallo-hydrolase, partial [Aquabacterium sp.]|nr:MBL fold metallo-hydrolase [Aquabacterium sp.]